MTGSKLFIPTNVLILVIFSSCVQKGQLQLSDLNNREVIEGIRSKAVPISKLKHRGYGSKRILCDAMGQRPFSGWVLTEGRVSGVPSSGLIKYRQGKPHGYTVELQANSMKKLKLGAYADGEEKGAWTAWHNNGNKAAEGNYSDGKKMGLWKEWHDNGQASSEYNYEDGRIVGLANQWRRDGSLLEKGSYAKGLREGEWAFYPLNDQVGKGYYSKGRKQNGIFFNWGLNGGKLSKERFKASCKDGNQSIWHKNGSKHHELSYAKGKLMSADSWKPNGSKCPVTKISKGNGTLVYYDDSGSEAKRNTFKKGVKESKRGSGGFLMMLKLMNAGKKMEEAKKSKDPVKKIKAATELMNSIRDTSKEIKKLREENLKATGEADPRSTEKKTKK